MSERKAKNVRALPVQPADDYEFIPGHTFGPNADDELRMSVYFEIIPRLVGAELADRVRWIWGSLEIQYKHLPLPVCGQHGEAAFQLAWNLPDVYLDLEIQQDHRLAWTWIDRVAGTCEGEEGKLNFAEFGRRSEGALPMFFEHLEAIGAKPRDLLPFQMPRGPTGFVGVPGVGLIEVKR